MARDAPGSEAITRTFRKVKETEKKFRFEEDNDVDPEVAGFLYVRKAYVPPGCKGFQVAFTPIIEE